VHVLLLIVVVLFAGKMSAAFYIIVFLRSYITESFLDEICGLLGAPCVTDGICRIHWHGVVLLDRS
jgi:hypothetical protein